MKWVRVFVLDQDVSHGAEESGGARYGSFQLARHRDTSSPSAVRALLCVAVHVAACDQSHTHASAALRNNPSQSVA